MHQRNLSRALAQLGLNEGWPNASERELAIQELIHRLRIVSRQWVQLQSLQLDAAERRIVHHTILRERTPRWKPDDAAFLVDVYLLDHALLFVRLHPNDGWLELFKPPIPLDLLIVPPDTEETERGAGVPISFIHRGRRNSSVTLVAQTAASRTELLDKITEQQAVVWQQRAIFKLARLFGKSSKSLEATCVAPLNRWRSVLIATSDGVYRYDRSADDTSRNSPYRVLSSTSPVTWIDVDEGSRLLFILVDHTLTAFPLDTVSPEQPIAPHRQGQIVSNMTSFFVLGFILGYNVVAVVRSRPIASYIKLYVIERQRPALSHKPGPDDATISAADGTRSTLRFWKRIEHPIEISWIRLGSTKISIGCSRGISLVDVESLYTQDVIDPTYGPTSPLSRIEGDRPRPLGMFRIDGEFLLCYDRLAFFVSAVGSQARQRTVIYWEGEPTSFALRTPYIFAFSPTFVEVRHLVTGELAQTIHSTNMRCLTLPSELRGTASVGDSVPPPYSAEATDTVTEDLLLINSNEDVMAVRRLGLESDQTPSSSHRPVRSNTIAVGAREKGPATYS